MTKFLTLKEMREYGEELAEQVAKEMESEPVACVCSESDYFLSGVSSSVKTGELDNVTVGDRNTRKFTQLHTAPPQREWQGLTDEEVNAMHYFMGEKWSTTQLVRHVESMLQEKNL